MRYVDAFNHFFPGRIYELPLQSPAGQKDLGKRMRGIPALYDVDERMRVVESFPDYSQVICLGMPAIDRLAGPAESPEWARIGNDGLAELVAKHPDHFVGYAASLPMNAAEEAVKEAERVLSNGANAIQMHTNVDGAPIDQDQFLPIYEIIWPFETGAALARLVFSGIMDRFPDLKVISHHLGGIIPYFEGRVAHSWDQLGARTSDEDYSLLLKKLKKRPFDYFKGFYGDTALAGARAPTVCGLSFFGADHVLFASDCPFDKEKGRGYIRSTIEVIESLDLSQADREKICHKNAETMFGLRPR